MGPLFRKEVSIVLAPKIEINIQVEINHSTPGSVITPERANQALAARTPDGRRALREVVRDMLPITVRYSALFFYLIFS